MQQRAAQLVASTVESNMLREPYNDVGTENVFVKTAFQAKKKTSKVTKGIFSNFESHLKLHFTGHVAVCSPGQ
eukprot:10372405-Karenia_brevis.AAC.1